MTDEELLEHLKYKIITTEEGDKNTFSMVNYTGTKVQQLYGLLVTNYGTSMVNVTEKTVLLLLGKMVCENTK